MSETTATEYVSSRQWNFKENVSRETFIRKERDLIEKMFNSYIDALVLQARKNNAD